MSDGFGVTAWGRDWIRLAQPISITRPNPALPRARTFARNDQVVEVVIAAGSITAAVSGKRTHVVTLSCATWAEPDIKRAEDVLAAVPAGDLPDSVHAECIRGGLVLLEEMTSICDCTQRATPCVHILAVFFEIARRVDEQPLLAFELRGVHARSDRDPTRILIEHIDPANFYG